MIDIQDYYNKIILGDCVTAMKKMPNNMCDIIFADPPYNLQLNKKLYRPNNTSVKGVEEDWDKFKSFEEYDNFSRQWLEEAQRILKPNGTIWVMGSYHNIFRLGKIMQDMQYWILNEITWAKTNPMPNFRGVRFTNAQETLIWAKRKQSDKKYYFNYQAMKALNDDSQMTSVWKIPICSGKERLKQNKKTLHPTQKPMALLYRVILSSTKKGDLILDPFFGTGTTGLVAKLLGRNFIGIELDSLYVEAATSRINNIHNIDFNLLGQDKLENHKVSLGNLIESGLIDIGDTLFNIDYNCNALVCANGTLFHNNNYYSINKLAKDVVENNINAWTFWYIKKDNKALLLNDLRKTYIDHYLNITK